MMGEPQILPDESEARYTPPRPECPHPEYWTSPDEDATEYEVLDGLYGLIRMLQPDYVVETGSYLGHGTLAIGRALLENGHGHLDSIEIDPVRAAEASKRCEGLPVTVHAMDSGEFQPREPIDFAWFDSGPGTTRFKEFALYYPQMHDRTIVAFHDSSTRHKSIRALCLEAFRHELLLPIFLPTPRGVALCQVVPRG